MLALIEEDENADIPQPLHSGLVRHEQSGRQRDSERVTASLDGPAAGRESPCLHVDYRRVCGCHRFNAGRGCPQPARWRDWCRDHSRIVDAHRPIGGSATLSLDSLDLIGSPNTAMTLEFVAAGGANTFESVQ